MAYDSLGNHLRSGFTLQTYGALLPGTNGSTSTIWNPLVVESVILPDGSFYAFQYDPYGEVSQVTLPTGGVYQYDYPNTTDTSCSASDSACLVPYTRQTSGDSIDEKAVYRRVTARRVYPNGSTLEGRTCYAPSYPANTTVQVTYLDGTATDCTHGTTLSTETHTFNGNPTATYWNQPPDSWYEHATTGRETQGIWSSAAGTALKTVNTTWQELGSPTYQDATACQVLTTLSGTSSSATSGTFTVYDQYFNVSDVYEYDFGSAPGVASTCPATVPSNWGRHTHTVYQSSPWADTPTSGSGLTSNHMRSLVQQRDVYGPGGQAAMTTYVYDATAPTAASGTPAGYTAPPHSERGDLTSAATHLDATTQNPPTTTYTYDVLGNVLTVTDPRSNKTTISYSDSCSAGPGGTLDEFPTKITNALSQTVNITYDCYIGKQTNFEDANLVNTSYSYDILNTTNADPFDRLVLAKRAVGKTGVETHTTFLYPNLTTVTTEQDQTSPDDRAIVSTIYYDGLGRQQESQRTVVSGSQCITVIQTYDAKGRPYTKSLPYNSCGSETEHLVTTSYVGANRATSVATDDGSATATSYSANQTTVTDPAGAARTLTYDGFGRITSVVEDPSGLDYTTSYTYDTLDDLQTVTQGALPKRQFTYDWLKRLVTAYNPESGTFCYGTYVKSACQENYDADSNLLSRVDANSITTSYSYDALNRQQTKSYSDGKTPTVTYTYDSAGGSTTCPSSASAYDVGRLTAITTPALGSVPAVTEYLNYDPLGRACFSQEQVASNGPYPFGYQYNLASGLTTETYPSGRAVATTFDAQNRPNGVAAGTTAYARSVTYASSDAVSQIQFGSSSSPVATETVAFDWGSTTLREQPTSITIASAGTTPLTLNYWYCAGQATSCSSDNGNLEVAGIVTPQAYGGLSLTQTFAYDKVNRLGTAVETGGSNEWSQTYGPKGAAGAADAFGNHWVSAGTTISSFTPTASTNFTNNQLFIQNSSYDSAGNQKAIGGLNNVPAYSFTYDAENRQSSATFPTGTATYSYDGEGRRVIKVTGGVTTVYVYDAMGEVVAEYSTNPPTQTGT